MNEEKLAAKIVSFLEDDLYELYFEVQGPGGRADIVGKCGALIHVIEVKTKFNWQVLEQAIRWRPYAHYVSVAVQHPERRTTLLHKDAMRSFLRYKGIGVLTVRNRCVDWIIKPTLLRKAATSKINLLEEHKTWGKPGNANNEYYTAFGGTKRNLLEHLKGHPGCTMADIMKEVPHHYSTVSSAKSCLNNYMMTGVIEGVRVDTSSKPHRYYLDEIPRSIEMNNEEIEAGQKCPTEECEGTVEDHNSDMNCSCHISPPCQKCTDNKLYCSECGWSSDDENHY